MAQSVQCLPRTYQVLVLYFETLALAWREDITYTFYHLCLFYKLQAAIETLVFVTFTNIKYRNFGLSCKGVLLNTVSKKYSLN
jgi:hypothetical protein